MKIAILSGVCTLGLALSGTVAAGQMSNGDIYRLLATDTAAFDQADLNGDGRVSDVEFDRFKAALNRGQTGSTGARAALGGYDLNNDGALTPYELYPEADYVIDTE